MPSSGKSLVVGRHLDRSRQFLAVALALVPVTLGAYELYLHSTLGCSFSFPFHVGLTVVGLTAFHAYRNDGLLVCWALGVGPTFGFELYFYVLAFGHRNLWWGVVNAVTNLSIVVALVLATVGFLGGAGLRRAVEFAGVRVPV
ncbi:hypothetical protein BRC82_00475 [Halobacteriales archaeon QS_1_67_19]|nr:MAG: hypothetical protein BRC82_00475 [Halobacteriales archaeon QS_1_67_19]